MTEKKKTTFAQYVLYIILSAFVAPYLISRDHSDTVLKVGKTQFSEKDIVKINELYKQEGMPSIGYQHLILSEESALYTNNLHKFLFFLRPKAYGLSVSEQMIENYIKNLPAAESDGKFSLLKYEEFLKELGLTDSVFKQTVQNFLSTKQLLIAPTLFIQKIINLPKYKEYVDNIWKAFRQVRYGKILTINTNSFKPSFSDIEKEELEDFFIQHQDDFMLEASGTMNIISFGQISETTFTNIINDIKEGMSESDLVRKWNAENIDAKVENNNIQYNHEPKTLLSADFVKKLNSLIQTIKEPQLNRLFPASDTNGKYIIKITSLKSQEKISAKYFNTTVLTAWKNKDLTNTVIKKWIKQKNIEQAKKTKNISTKGKQISIKLQEIIPANMISFKNISKQKLSDTELAIGRALFNLKPGQHTIISVNDEHYQVILEKITYNEDSPPKILEGSLIAFLFNDLLTEYTKEIMFKYR